MKGMRALAVVLALLLSAGLAFAQASAPRGQQQQQLDIVDALGKLTLTDLKQAVPRATESPVRAEPGSRLAQVGAVTKLSEPGDGAAYYFNRAGVLVSAQTKATRPIPKQTLMREIKGLEFKKFPPNQISAAFVRRSPQVVQGFYLDQEERYVTLTTYDYVPR
jgi:hypothetical protein